MGFIIFIVAIVVEVALAVFCIATKSYQKPLRSVVAIAAFTVSVLLTMLPTIDWGWRYYPLFALLVSRAAIGLVSLICKKEDHRGCKSSRIVLKATAMTALIFVLTLPAVVLPQYKALVATGEYEVATTTYTFTDTSRIETYTDTGENRKLTVGMWYPENADGTYPLIVFSHGGLGVRSSNESLYIELASYGYVVCSVDHTYQGFYTTDVDGHTTWIDRGFMRDIMAEDALSNRQQSYEYYQKWMNVRTGDINFVIDRLLSGAQHSEADIVYKLIDSTEIGVMGHSLGGSAALGIGRLRDDISAVIALESPFMCDIKGVEDGEFVFTDETYPVPVLNIYSDSSWSILSKRPQYARNYALLSDTEATAFNVYISGVGHLTLTDFALTSPFLTRVFNGHKSPTETEYCLKTINKVCLEFFDCYLKGKGEFTSGGAY